MIKLDLCPGEIEERGQAQTNQALISVCHLVASRGTAGTDPAAHSYRTRTTEAN